MKKKKKKDKREFNALSDILRKIFNDDQMNSGKN